MERSVVLTELRSSTDYGWSVERTAKLHPLCREGGGGLGVPVLACWRWCEGCAACCWPESLLRLVDADGSPAAPIGSPVPRAAIAVVTNPLLALVVGVLRGDPD